MRRCAIVVGLTLVSMLAASDLFAQFGSLRGKVVDTDGNPVPDATVVVEPIRGQAMSLNSKTGDDGKFQQLTTHTSGPWVVTITKEGYVSWRTPDPIRVPLSGAPVTLPTVTLARTAPSAEEVRSQQFKGATDLLIAADAAWRAGDATGAREKLDAAEAAFTEFVELNPALSGGYFNLALVLDRKQEWNQASANYLKALELEPEMVDASVGAGAALINAREPARAAEVLEAALARNTDHTRLQSLLALARYNEGRLAEAAALFETVREAAPADPEPCYYLGMIAVQENRADDAVALLEEYLSLDPLDPANVETARDLIAALKKTE
jgi:Flp pilus assembly protein TadD